MNSLRSIASSSTNNTDNSSGNPSLVDLDDDVEGGDDDEADVSDLGGERRGTNVGVGVVEEDLEAPTDDGVGRALETEVGIEDDGGTSEDDGADVDGLG